MNSYGKFNSPSQAEAHSDSGMSSIEPTSSSALPPEHHELYRKKKSTPGLLEQKSLWNTEIIGQALIDAFTASSIPAGWSKNPRDVCC